MIYASTKNLNEAIPFLPFFILHCCCFNISSTTTTRTWTTWTTTIEKWWWWWWLEIKVTWNKTNCHKFGCIPPPLQNQQQQQQQHYMVMLSAISYTEKYRDLQQKYRDVQEKYRTRDFVLECSRSAPVRSCVYRIGTYPTLKTFPRFFNYRSFEGVEAPERCENVA